MQFQYNADYPGLGEFGPTATPEALTHDPASFPPAEPRSCAKITARVYHPQRGQIATVQNVLVVSPGVVSTTPMSMNNQSMMMTTTTASTGNINNNDNANSNGAAMQNGSGSFHTSSSSGMSSSSSSSSDDDSMNLDDGVERGGDSGGNNPSSSPPATQFQLPQHAYWMQRTIREAIYGRVLFAVILRRRSEKDIAADGCEWEVTGDQCAVKEMSWQHIRRERERLAEDPIKEVACMQYIRKLLQSVNAVGTSGLPGMVPTEGDIVAESFRTMNETNIMMPLDLLSDERNLYSIMPYADGGELFEVLDTKERFTEEESRYWFDQVLNGIENLQRAGICHRDMSLENLLVHKDGALIIDMGMCLLIPYQETSLNLTATFNDMNMNGVPVTNGNITQQQQQQQQQQQLLQKSPSTQTQLPQLNNNTQPLSGRQRPRYLIKPQGTCGKWLYMSPEIHENKQPFDGFAVDMWAAGVILFLMMTGFPPWERASNTDERFYYMTGGYLVQMLTEWQLGLSSDAMDLLQRMLFLDPKDRLSLDQVRAHPW
eukprot:CAMPEP_0113480400 /NCGR_PEP_ID=MMETSP0014_2-20120614/21855_1 /TAXON_ID=2857 /ORGANISM="Nitzschia sp." /LENGTH=542 /DNA_ID=CAMNT_0000373827 /DNA_START=482 /DNA_END=2107 /DNA_ORIENTATION=- /assembly_acc=CAM_ASM_000159